MSEAVLVAMIEAVPVFLVLLLVVALLLKNREVLAS